MENRTAYHIRYFMRSDLREFVAAVSDISTSETRPKLNSAIQRLPGDCPALGMIVVDDHDNCHCGILAMLLINTSDQAINCEARIVHLESDIERLNFLLAESRAVRLAILASDAVTHGKYDQGGQNDINLLANSAGFLRGDDDRVFTNVFMTHTTAMLNENADLSDYPVADGPADSLSTTPLRDGVSHV